LKSIIVHASWDDEARVWVATSEDVAGLAIEAETIERLAEKVVPALSDLIELNGLRFDQAEIPVEIRAEQRAKVLNPIH
jgi:hypothetical protein